ncbi:uncharacterized protein LOC129322770 [Prosopis cineraria]|uniref:uncharacterized protein LOC129322770 n=1 Tax=Prosopis cineraria TaxID=364024 RepID=UPI00240F68F9|nr:uncharacterized protein LOC129322770 [Prosopis cineraria]
MATSTMKSQPLHNFSLPFLKWGGKNQTNTTHRCRRQTSGDSSQPIAAVADHNSEPESESETRPCKVGSRTSRNRFGFSSGYLGEKSLKQRQQHEPLEVASNNETDDEAGVRKRETEDAEEAEAEDIVQKPWNLRPRKPIFSRGTVEIGVGPSRHGDLQETSPAVTGVHSVQQEENHPQPKLRRLRCATETQNTERKKKRRFWIALSKEEIEEDIFVMTGSRPARRPKKRHKNVQKQLDFVFPGLWLVGLSADAYKGLHTPPKR